MGWREHQKAVIVGGAVAVFGVGICGLAAVLNMVTAAPNPVVPSDTPSPSSSVSVELSPSPEASALYFKTCTDAVKAGVPLPIRSNEPGYRVALDGDEDGEACE